MLPTIGGSGSSSGISATYLNQLIQQTLAKQRLPLDRLKQEKDRIELRRAVYNDLERMLATLRDEALKLKGSASNSVMGNMTASSSHPNILTATALSSASRANYTIVVSSLATAHQVRGEAQLYSDQPLGLSGTFVLGQRATRSAEWTPDASGVVIGGDTSAIAAGQTELRSGEYYVEIRQAQSGQWQFRLVDSHGTPVTIANGGETGLYTSSWQNMSEGAYTFDTGRGLTIQFSEERAAAMRPAAAKVTYYAQGVTVSVQESHSLQDIASMINAGTYAEGEAVRASIVDRQLVLTSANTGEDFALRISTVDAPTGDVLSGLGIWENGQWKHIVQQAQNASFMVNNIAVSRSRNAGLDDVISGVTLNLLAPTESNQSVTLSVGPDNVGVTKQVNSFVSKVNSLNSYLSSKTAIKENTDGTYTRGGLAGDTIFERLRLNLISDLIGAVSELSEGAPKSLREIGISFDADTLQLTISDSSALATALETKRAGVIELLEHIMTRVENRLSLFIGDAGLLQRSISRLDSEASYIKTRITAMEQRLSDQEVVLTRKYGRMLYQMAQLQGQFYSTMMLSSLGVNTTI